MDNKPPISFTDVEIAAKSAPFGNNARAWWRTVNAVIKNEGIPVMEAAFALASIMKVTREQILEKLNSFPARERDIKRTNDSLNSIRKT